MEQASLLPREIRGARLRRLRAGDLPDFQAYRTIPGLGRFQGWVSQTDAEAAAFLQAMADAPLFAPGRWLQIGIAEDASDRLVGDIGLCLAGNGRFGEVGFTLAPKAQGRGLATAAVAAAVRLFFEHTSADDMFATADTRNLPSVRLLERVGFVAVETRDAEFRGEPCRETRMVLPRSRSG